MNRARVTGLILSIIGITLLCYPIFKDAVFISGILMGYGIGILIVGRFGKNSTTIITRNENLESAKIK